MELALARPRLARARKRDAAQCAVNHGKALEHLPNAPRKPRGCRTLNQRLIEPGQRRALVHHPGMQADISGGRGGQENLHGVSARMGLHGGQTEGPTGR